jgi:hypothetical protein
MRYVYAQSTAKSPFFMYLVALNNSSTVHSFELISSREVHQLEMYAE